MKACRPWLEAELRAVQPEVVVCLGATAAQSLFGPAFKLMQNRGTVLASDSADRVVATIHPSAVLRSPNRDAREQTYAMLVADLIVARLALRKRKRTRRGTRSASRPVEAHG